MRLVRSRLALRAFTDNWRKLLEEASKFGVIGAVNTVVNFAVFNLLIWTVFAHGQLKANVVATVVATTSSYFMNRHWTYRDRPKSTLRREYTLFFLFNLAGMLIELGALGLAKYGFGTDTPLTLNVAKALALVLGMVFRFWAYRTIVFRDNQPGPASVSASEPEADFDQLTEELEVELDPPLDPVIQAELDSARFSADQTTPDKLSRTTQTS